MTGTYYAFFSQSAKEVIGSVWWRRADGTEVEITAVGQGSPMSVMTQYLWEDARYVGEVVEYSRLRLSLNKRDRD